MLRPDQDDRHDKSADLAGWAALLFAGILAAVSVTASLMVLNQETLHPAVGDIVVFRPGELESGPWRVTAAAERDGMGGHASGSCTLDSAVLAAEGGSLIVEAADPDRAAPFRVHWAGPRTGDGSKDCGASADLWMSKLDLRKLATIAGGFGVNPGGLLSMLHRSGTTNELP